MTPVPRLTEGLRNDPRHATELLLLHALPQLAPQVRRWHAAATARHPGEDHGSAAQRAVHRAVVRARHDGAVIGSSFYVGMPAATASVYCNQVRLVLQIASLCGLDPGDPARAAEILVIQGRHADTAGAVTALQAAGRRVERAGEPRRSLWRASADVVRQVPPMIGVQIEKVKQAGPFGWVLTVARVASYVLPVVSIPVWAASNARSTRKLGGSALAYYSNPTRPPAPDPALTLPPALSRLVRSAVAAVCVVAGIGFGIWALGPAVAAHHRTLHSVRLVLVLGLEVVLVITVGRLLWITRR